MEFHEKKKKFAAKYLELPLLYIKTPIQITIGGKDDVVCNQTAEKLFNLLPKELPKSFNVVEDLDHGPFYDNLLYKGFVKQSHEWFIQSQ